MKVRDEIEKMGVHIQEEPYACGPATILNILKIKGINEFTEKELIVMCNANPEDGSKYSDFLKGIQAAGLEIMEEKSNGTIADIERNINEGLYVIVNYFQTFSQVGHYSVITQYDDKAFYFIDSSMGLFRLEKSEFEDWWHNTDKSAYGRYVAVK